MGTISLCHRRSLTHYADVRVFLSGLMGTGKSTVGRALAASLGARFVDLDDRIVEKVGTDIASYFRLHGEPAFRKVEQSEALALLRQDDVVVALGGGTICDAETRAALFDRGLLITLDAPDDVLAARVVADGSDARPLLADDAGAAIARLRRLRHAAYSECHARVNTNRAVESTVAELRKVVAAQPMAVRLGERSYSIQVGSGVRELLPTVSVMHVADTNTCIYAADDAFVLKAGEAHKTLDAVVSIWDEALERGLDRSSMLVGVGGGVVGDLTGFAAASLLRGVPFGLVATSIIAMVDSSVGGKTGFNRPQGKNLIGAFHQPSFVLCDLQTLKTLDEDEFRAGLAEVVKSAWLSGSEAVAGLEADSAALNARDLQAVERAIRMSIGLKARIVERDEREAGQRMLLNLGHTFGHAFEVQAGFGALRHGDAVALGMAAACDVAAGLGQVDIDRLKALLRSLRLPTDYREHLTERSFEFLRADKKRAGDGVRFVLPGEPGGAEIRRLSFDELRQRLRA